MHSVTIKITCDGPVNDTSAAGLACELACIAEELRAVQDTLDTCEV